MLCVLYSETSGASRDIIWRGSWTNMFVSLSRQSLLLHSCLTCIRCLQSTPFRDNTVQVTETVSYYVFSLYHNAASYTKCFSHTIHTSLYWHVDILTNNARLHEVQNISLPVVTRTQQNSTIYDYFRRPSFVKIRLVLGNIPEHVTQGKYARWGAYHKIFHYIYILRMQNLGGCNDRDSTPQGYWEQFPFYQNVHNNRFNKHTVSCSTNIRSASLSEAVWSFTFVGHFQEGVLYDDACCPNIFLKKCTGLQTLHIS
jgi:hypothetical protein